MTKKVSTKSNYTISYNRLIENAWRRAKNHTGKEGYILSLPELITKFPGFIKFILKDWVTANTEELYLTIPKGKYVLNLHGGGILTERTETIEYGKEDIVTEKETRNIFDGKLPDDTNIEIINFDDLKRGKQISNRRHGILLDFETARSIESKEYHPIKNLYENPLFVCRTGSFENAKKYLDGLIDGDECSEGLWHPYNDRQFNPNFSQGSILFVGYSQTVGYSGTHYFFNEDGGRFVSYHPTPESIELDEVIEALKIGRGFKHQGRIWKPK